jgi:hypothetical protein
MGIFDRLVGKRKATDSRKRSALDRILEHLGIKEKEIVLFKKVDPHNSGKLTRLANKLVSSENRIVRIGLGKVETPVQCVNYINEMIDTIVGMEGGPEGFHAERSKTWNARNSKLPEGVKRLIDDALFDRSSFYKRVVGAVVEAQKRY